MIRYSQMAWFHRGRDGGGPLPKELIMLICKNYKRFIGTAFVFISLITFVLAQPSLAGQSKTESELKEIIIVYKTHFDIGYSDLAKNVIHNYRTEMMDHTLRGIERNKSQPKEHQFVWTIPGWPMGQLLWPGQEPSRKKKIERAIREGNLVLHALPFTMHTETLEMEDLVRGLGHACSIARTYGVPLPRGAKMTDVPSHSWFIPTLLRHAGVDFIHLGCNAANVPVKVPLLFWWQGPDGSRLLTMYSHGYGTSPMPPKDWPYKTWIYINHTGDNVGPPSPETVQRNIDYYKKHAPLAKVRIGRLEDFADAILDEKPDLPVVRSDMPDTWIHGVMSLPQGTKIAQTVRPIITATEALNTIEKCWGLHVPNIAETIEMAYEQSLLYGEHTWGLATQHYIDQPYGKDWEEMLARGLPSRFRLLEEAWNEHLGYILEARNLISGQYHSHVSNIADNVDVKGRRIVVYNPLPWKRDGMVSLNVCYWPHFDAIKPVDGGPTIPVVRQGRPHSAATRGFGKIIQFVAKDIPPMGYRTYIIADTPPKAAVSLKTDKDSGTIESPYFKARLDPVRGRIVSLIDKRSNRELVDNSAPQGFGQYLYERFGKKEVVEEYLNNYTLPQYHNTHRILTGKFNMPDAPYSCAVPANMNLYFESSAISASAVMTGTIIGSGMPQSVSIRLTLYADMPVADLEIAYQKQPDGWPEAGWICLPFNFEKFKFRLGRLGADIDPTTDITTEYCNYHQMWLNTGVAVYEKGGFGVGVCPVDSPLISLGKPGSHKFSRRYVPKKPWIYFNLYNNQWQTNFPGWVGGKHVSRVRIWTFEKFNSENALYTPAMESRIPLHAVRSSAEPGNLPATQAGLSLSRKGVAVTAFGPGHNSRDTLLRLWEQAGISGKLIVTLPKGLNASRAVPVNLRGEKIGPPIAVTDNTLAVGLHAYAPATFLLR